MDSRGREGNYYGEKEVKQMIVIRGAGKGKYGRGNHLCAYSFDLN